MGYSPGVLFVRLIIGVRGGFIFVSRGLFWGILCCMVWGFGVGVDDSSGGWGLVGGACGVRYISCLGYVFGGRVVYISIGDFFGGGEVVCIRGGGVGGYEVYTSVGMVNVVSSAYEVYYRDYSVGGVGDVAGGC